MPSLVLCCFNTPMRERVQGGAWVGGYSIGPYPWAHLLVVLAAAPVSSWFRPLSDTHPLVVSLEPVTPPPFSWLYKLSFLLSWIPSLTVVWLLVLPPLEQTIPYIKFLLVENFWSWLCFPVQILTQRLCPPELYFSLCYNLSLCAVVYSFSQALVTPLVPC